MEKGEIPTETPVVEMISDSIEVIETDPGIIPVVESEDEEVEPIINLNKNNTLTEAEPTDSEKLVKTFLNKYNQKEFKDACEILVDTKCDARVANSVKRFGEEFEKMENGYENISVHQVDLPDFHSDVLCVEYDYRYKSSSNPNPVHEIMSFYVQDGKITYRICEDKTRKDSNLECPIQARRSFCL